MSNDIFGVVSDQHFHAWSAFSVTNPDGVNSRLQNSIDELLRAGKEVKDAGGNLLLDAGDVFHVRGSLAPTVLNPVEDAYKYLIDELGLRVVILAGNHDMEGKQSARISNAVTTLGNIGCEVVNEPTVFHDIKVVMLPWNPRLDTVPATADRPEIIGLRDQIKLQIDKIDVGEVGEYTLLMHAPLDDVIDGLPSKGFTPAEVAGFGFKRVFCGHYHHRKEFPGDVWSVGSTTQHNWGDVNSVAGYLIVTPEGVTPRASNAPAFVDIDASTDPDEIPLIVPGNYVRVKIDSNKASEKLATQGYMMKLGAAGATVIQSKCVVATATRTAKINAGATMEGSISEFIKGKSYRDAAKVTSAALDILSQVRSSKGAA